MRLQAFRIIVKIKTPLVGHVLREEPMLVNAADRERAVRIARAYHEAKKVEGELPFVDIRDVIDLGPL